MSDPASEHKEANPVTHNARLTACALALLLAAGPAWAQSCTRAASDPLHPIQQVSTPFHCAGDENGPVAQEPWQAPCPYDATDEGHCGSSGFTPAAGFRLCGAEAPASACTPNNCCAWAALAGSADGNSTRATVVELMRLFRMLYRQGRFQDAEAVAKQVLSLDPVLGRAALMLTSCRSEQGACMTGGACAGSCRRQTGTASQQGCRCRTPAGSCACGDGCKCCQGDKSKCACGQACKCKKTAGHAAVAILCRPALPNLVWSAVAPAPLMPLPCPPVALGSQFAACAPPCPIFAGPAPVCTCVPPCGVAVPPAGCCVLPMPSVGPAKPVRGLTCATVIAAPAKPSKPEGGTEIRISAVGGRVHIETPCVQVECDRVISLQGQDRVLMEGRVDVQFRSGMHPANIVAQRMAVGLRDGSYDVMPHTAGCCTQKATKAAAGCSHGCHAVKPAAHEEAAPTCPCQPH
jgi:hypothetical protein